MASRYRRKSYLFTPDTIIWDVLSWIGALIFFYVLLCIINDRPILPDWLF